MEELKLETISLREDPTFLVHTLRAYVALCQRGGEASFQSLAKSAGLISPFETDCLKDVVGLARKSLGV